MTLNSISFSACRRAGRAQHRRVKQGIPQDKDFQLSASQMNPGGWWEHADPPKRSPLTKLCSWHQPRASPARRERQEAPRDTQGWQGSQQAAKNIRAEITRQQPGTAQSRGKNQSANLQILQQRAGRRGRAGSRYRDTQRGESRRHSSSQPKKNQAARKVGKGPGRGRQDMGMAHAQHEDRPLL